MHFSHSFRSQIFNRKTRRFLVFLGFLVGLLDILVIGSFKSYSWVLTQEWLMWCLWVAGVLGLCIVRANLLKRILFFQLSQENTAYQTWMSVALRQYLGYQNDGPKGRAWTQERWEAYTERVFHYTKDQNEYDKSLIHVLLLCGVMCYFQWFLAIIALILGLLLIRPPKKKWHEVTLSQQTWMETWWKLASQSWCLLWQNSALDWIQAQRHSINQQNLQLEFKQKSHLIQTELKSHLITVLLLAISLLILRLEWMNLDQLLGFGMCLILLHPPFKKMMHFSVQRRQFRAELRQWYKNHLYSKKLKYPQGMGESLLIKNLSYEISGGRNLWDLTDLELKGGESLWVRGPSGSGKTTFFRTLVSLLALQKGEFHLPQGLILYLDQIPVPPQVSSLQLLAIKCQDDENWMSRLELTELITRFTENLSEDLLDLAMCSGGEIQRLCLWMILCQKPKMLILDEAFSRQNPRLRTQGMRWIIESCHNNEQILIFSAHENERYENVKIWELS